MKKLILYIVTLLIVFFGFNFAKNINTINHTTTNDLEIKNVNAFYKTPLNNHNFNSLFLLVEVEDDSNENELPPPFLIIRKLTFNLALLYNECALSTNKSKKNNCNTFYSIPIYTAIKSFRI